MRQQLQESAGAGGIRSPAELLRQQLQAGAGGMRPILSAARQCLRAFMFQPRVDILVHTNDVRVGPERVEYAGEELELEGLELLGRQPAHARIVRVSVVSVLRKLGRLGTENIALRQIRIDWEPSVLD